MRALVMVLGDLGRSPRMLAHAGALLRAGHEVHLVGGTRTSLPSALQGDPSLHVHSLEIGGAGRGGGWAASLVTGIRGVRLGWAMARVLLRDTPTPDLVLLQSPPSLPTLPVALAAARLRGARIIVDWHNLGWTLLALRFGPSHALVRLTRWAERVFGWRADGHLAVSHLLASHLRSMGLRDVTVLHDGPSSVRPFPPARDDLPADPLVVVAPMGWTRDDDLPVLAEALRLLVRRLDSDPNPRRGLLLLVSGNGPLRAMWGPKLRAVSGGAVRVETPDVPAEDYPGFLAASHLGLCLHRSSSRLDLPMKIVELQTVGVPVLVLEDGSPLQEIAPPGCGVLRYGTAEELAGWLFAALAKHESGADFLTLLTAQARSYRPDSWDNNWTESMKSLFPPAK